jgi:hypothetical protein
VFEAYPLDLADFAWEIHHEETDHDAPHYQRRNETGLIDTIQKAEGDRHG